jgi:hypothetical protein
MTSLNELLQIEQPCVLGHLIDLMDLPNGRDTNGDFRRLIWKDVQRRTGSMPSPKPPYDPYGSQETRVAQKNAWLLFIRDKSPS